MFRKPFLWLVAIALVFFISLKIGSGVHTALLFVSDHAKSLFLSVAEGVSDSWGEYFDQRDEIRLLRAQLRDKDEMILKSLALESENQLLQEVLRSAESLHLNFSGHLVRILSYAELGSYERVWLEHPLKNMPENKIFGLVFNNAAAGIALSTNGRLLGILNGDPNSVYSVRIGKNKAPGIIKAQRGKENIFADYIPSWFDVQVGDEVVTSGLDGIFFEGVKVGRVVSVETSRGYFVAEIKPEIDIYSLRYIWLIDLNKNQDFDEGSDVVKMNNNTEEGEQE